MLSIIYKSLCQFLFLISLFHFLFSSYSTGQEYGYLKIRNYLPKEYNQIAQNWAIVQDSRGVMYFGNNDGVLEYDGVNWRLIELSNQSAARSLVKDDNGKIYVGGIGEFGFLEPDKTGLMQFVSLVNKIEDKTLTFQVVFLTQFFGNEIFFITEKILFRLKDGKIKSWNTDGVFRNCFIANKQMLISIKGKGILKIEGDSLVPFPYGEFFKDGSITFYNDLNAEKGLFWTDYKGLFTYDFSLLKSHEQNKIIKRFPTDIDQLLQNNLLLKVVKLNNGNFALGILNVGLVIINRHGKLIRKINTQSGLQNEIIYSIFQDYEGNLWLALNKGISRVDINSPITYLNEEYGIKNIVINVIRFNGTIFTAGFDGLNYIKDNKVFHIPDIKREAACFLDFQIPGNPSKHILLIGTNVDGIHQLEGSNTKLVLDIKYPAWFLYQSKSDPSIIYIGGEVFLFIAKYDKRKWKLIGKLDKINFDIRSIEEDNEGNIWLCTLYDGVFQIVPSDNLLKPKEIIHYTEKDGLPSTSEVMVYPFNERLVFATPKGFFDFDKKKNRFVTDSTFGKEYSNGSTGVYNFFQDVTGRIWIAGSANDKGYVAVGVLQNNGTYKWVDTPFKIIPDFRIEFFYIESDATAWFAGSEGLYHFKGDLNLNHPSYNTIIRQITIDKNKTLYFDAMQDKNSTIRNIFEYENNSLKFHFAATSFYDESITEYQTYLEGFDKDWSVWSKDTKNEYTNLPDGEYKFLVRARNIYGKISEAGIFEFTILPPWYRTYFAFAGYIFLLSLLIYLFVYINSKRLKAINLRLEEVVKKRTAEVVNKNLEIESHLVELKNLNATKDRFFSIIAHDLKNPFQGFLGLTTLLKESYSELTQKEISESIDNLYITSNNVYQLLRNLLEWSKSHLNRLEFAPENLCLFNLAEECLWLIGNDAKEKNIEIRNEINKNIFVFADENLVKTIFRNLISNAIKFTQHNGSINISASVNDKYITVSIKDTGVGISPENVERLFRIDIKSNTLGTANERGTGLGLILCKEFIVKLGGNIYVESEEGKGSTFIFTLPKGN